MTSTLTPVPLPERLLAIWRDVLETHQVDADGLSVDGHLPDLGTRSILIIEIAMRIQREIGVDVPLETFIETRTIAELARAIVEIDPEADAR
ncbi:MAG TPA: acyl carrier protein [Streptomyces sp.]|uniref:acyl carrier protein n=1 Tax=Streptomyces sp. TaxID=1931 RepID=UPI002D3E05F0|nr:acyl carrier protein [Streptomyces sp.]HZG04771.1 acyl carrier protein [Streptomyces sp.]